MLGVYVVAIHMHQSICSSSEENPGISQIVFKMKLRSHIK